MAWVGDGLFETLRRVDEHINNCFNNISYILLLEALVAIVPFLLNPPSNQ